MSETSEAFLREYWWARSKVWTNNLIKDFVQTSRRKNSWCICMWKYDAWIWCVPPLPGPAPGPLPALLLEGAPLPLPLTPLPALGVELAHSLSSPTNDNTAQTHSNKSEEMFHVALYKWLKNENEIVIFKCWSRGQMW